jgi:hypothetical protein
MATSTTKITRQMKLDGKKFCYYIPASQTPETGFSPVIVVANESGYYETDYRWGNVKSVAEVSCNRLNDALGLTLDDVTWIISSSMRTQRGRRVAE